MTINLVEFSELTESLMFGKKVRLTVPAQKKGEKPFTSIGYVIGLLREHNPPPGHSCGSYLVKLRTDAGNTYNAYVRLP